MNKADLLGDAELGAVERLLHKAERAGVRGGGHRRVKAPGGLGALGCKDDPHHHRGEDP